MEPKVKSPCVKNCQIDERSGYCKGCLRTIGEITEWMFMSDEDKLKLLDELNKRSINDNNK
ncbi:MAG TPA: DUF1289 domain-containing protein [Ignavibacteriales bacterium]|nr:DUF1289 domain-containing protein [Ignavibacteriales bacterium]